MEECHANIAAVAELHRNAIAVCALLAAFAMASAYAANRALTPSGIERRSAMLLYIASMAFTSTVCGASVYLTAFARYTHLEALNGARTSECKADVFMSLFNINLFTGTIGLGALLFALGSVGYIVGTREGHFTALVAFATAVVMFYSVAVFLLSPISPI